MGRREKREIRRVWIRKEEGLETRGEQGTRLGQGQAPTARLSLSTIAASR